MDNKELLEKVLGMEWNRSLAVGDDERAGLILNLSHMIGDFTALDSHLAAVNHASRNGVENPIAIFSQRELETVSYPVNAQIGNPLFNINNAMCDESNMVGHLVIPNKGIEIKSDFAGSKGNLAWFNTGDLDLMLRVEMNKKWKSIVLKPGFGFCLGKREYMRVILSSFAKAEDLFANLELVPQRAHVLFFGFDGVDQDNWRGALNSENQAKQYREVMEQDKGGFAKMKERFHRLGIEPQNSRRNQIRIAPMMGSVIKKGCLSENIEYVRRWIRETLPQAKLTLTPTNFSVVQETEKPHSGDPFEVLWVKFEFEENMWDDQVMWDIRYLLMGSKLNKLAGFPCELRNLREKIFISRDSISERVRKCGSG